MNDEPIQISSDTTYRVSEDEDEVFVVVREDEDDDVE